ncbi:hypothetical protein U5A82_07215 [Sphingobium sp. CR2-8]|uniref:hypothetical protein n=1 Tax=Sphingobium sp. CR2-8 TaxID=1306534 RepID=UPI002DB94681|nr:hypothetical protein [Sphingobium sp. CR2-8]MEC3910278.1 hypothetical protein [Sphingobium sp. CR2-8]
MQITDKAWLAEISEAAMGGFGCPTRSVTTCSGLFANFHKSAELTVFSPSVLSAIIH